VNKRSKKILGDVGRCIYCVQSTRNERLTSEHLIPFGLNGPWELLRASCQKHSNVTSAFETRLLRGALLPARAKLRMRSRHRKKQPKQHEMILISAGQESAIRVSIENHLAPLILPIFKVPAFLDRRAYQSGMQVIGLRGIALGHSEELIETFQHKPFKASVTFHGNDFGRLLAKIGYCFAVAKFGVGSLSDVFVLPSILGEKDDCGMWVGCPLQDKFTGSKGFHIVEIEKANDLIACRIKLFAAYNMPEYFVVVGRLARG
jgi:hypothetical protein